MSERSTARIASNAALTLAGGVLGGILTLGNEVLLARLLGADRYGLYALAVVVAKAGELFSLFGLRVSLLHYLPIYREQGERARVSGTVLASLALPCAIALVLEALVWTGAPWAAQALFHDPRAAAYMRTIALSIPLLAATEILGNVGRGFGRASDYVLIRNLLAPGTFMILLAAIAAGWLGPERAPAAFVLSYLVAALAALVLAATRAGATLLATRPVFDLRGLYGYAFPIFLNTLFYAVLGWTDILLLGVFRTSDEVGVYRACLKLVLVFDLIAIAFNAATAHVYPVLAKQGKSAELGVVYATAVRWSSMLALLALGVLAVHRAGLLALLGPAFVAGSLPLLLLAIGQCSKAALGTAGFLLVISGRQRYETVNALLAAGLNIVLNITLIPRWGSIGAAAATMTALLVLNGVRVAQVRRLAGLVTWQPHLTRALVAAALAATLAAAGGLALERAGLAPPLTLALGVALTGVLVGAALWHSALQGSDRALVRRALRALSPGSPPTPRS